MFCSPEGELPRCGTLAFLQCLNFLPTSRETPEPPGKGNSDLFIFFAFCDPKLLKACLKVPALTGYVGHAQLENALTTSMSKQRGFTQLLVS